MNRRFVYDFEEVDTVEQQVGGSWDRVRALLGGKGANLAEMTRLGLPVPPGFTVTTEACLAYLKTQPQWPEGLWEEELEALRRLEEKTGKELGNPNRPLLVSCRSGAKFSMPGMMDTVLNLGLNDDVVVGLERLTGDRRFALDSYRRLIQMFGTVVVGLPEEPFEEVLEQVRQEAGVATDSELSAREWEKVLREFQAIYLQGTGEVFPQNPEVQIRRATEAVFRSWNAKRAVDYRNAAKISHDLGTAVNICTMVFGNLGSSSGTGVAMTRSGATGEPKIEGDFLVNAQGEDVVAGTRITEPIERLRDWMPEAYRQLEEICQKLEAHYRDVQDIEFTIEQGKLWMLQTRDAKRTARAAVRIAVDFAQEGKISREQAVLRVQPEHVDFFLHSQFEPSSLEVARRSGALLALGLNVSPGAAVGEIALDADTAERWARREGRRVIMVRPETKPDDVHGMLAADGILTSRGGRTSHAALVARQFGKPAVVGVTTLDVNFERRVVSIGGREFAEGTIFSIDGTTGEVFLGSLPTRVPDLDDPYLRTILEWADAFRRLEIWANADYPVDAERARRLGAQGIGLCRTEHMFFEPDRLPIVQKLILNREHPETVRECLDLLLPMQRRDFVGLLRAMAGRPVVIRLIDPPLHEFLPSRIELLRELGQLEREQAPREKLEEVQALLHALERLEEANPMLGLRGVRLGLELPELTRMQVRAIFEAACDCKEEGLQVFPEVMIPLVSTARELELQQRELEAEALRVMEERGIHVAYKFGTMIEVPRAALTARSLATYAQFFSFGTNDLTQTTFAISRDDAEKSFLMKYLERGILPLNPFASIDEEGVGRLMELAVQEGRQVRPDLEVGICGEHGGDPQSINFCHRLQLNYVSCSPLRIPSARLAAAHAALRERGIRPRESSSSRG
jgi:pyruvate,orthophosphate dikinase